MIKQTNKQKQNSGLSWFSKGRKVLKQPDCKRAPHLRWAARKLSDFGCLHISHTIFLYVSLTPGTTALMPTTSEPTNWLGNATLSFHSHLGTFKGNQQGEESGCCPRLPPAGLTPALQSWVPRSCFLHIQKGGKQSEKVLDSISVQPPETYRGKWQAPASDPEAKGKACANLESSAASKGRKLQSNSLGSWRWHSGLHGSNLKNGTLLDSVISPACSSA